jgi:hypothetical protein
MGFCETGEFRVGLIQVAGGDIYPVQAFFNRMPHRTFTQFVLNVEQRFSGKGFHSSVFAFDHANESHGGVANISELMNIVARDKD